MKRFPVLNSDQTIPWSVVEPHRKQALINHSQTLERLAERGGLSWAELVAVVGGLKWHELDPQKKLNIERQSL